MNMHYHLWIRFDFKIFSKYPVMILGTFFIPFCFIKYAKAMDEDICPAKIVQSQSSFRTQQEAPFHLRSCRGPFRDRARAFSWEREQRA